LRYPKSSGDLGAIVRGLACIGILGALRAGLGLQGNTSMRGDQTIGPAAAFLEGDIISVTIGTPPRTAGVAST
jgi:hypothetical protein